MFSVQLVPKIVEIPECRSDFEILNELAKRLGLKRYFWDEANWREGSLVGPLADATPIACGEGILFIHNGDPGQPDTLVLPTWYLRPPNTW